MNELEKKLNYSFKDIGLLNTALSHSSYANENKKLGEVCNERLEFLGDSILGVVTADYLYKNFPDMPEGQMTKTRSELVCEPSLHGVAQELNLGKYLRLGKGEEMGGGRTRPSIMADAVEAILAAVYLDGGIEEAAKIIKRFILVNVESGVKNHDYKTTLQEFVQKKNDQVLKYEMVDATGPDHAKTFVFRVLLNGEEIGEGVGRTKKEAEQNAARQALKELSK
ncbi:MAG: ribonuclease III [Ruminococcaceae bacterium]|nr:ribonuclease III [Oscillospiraceae bacterium]